MVLCSEVTCLHINKQIKKKGIDQMSKLFSYVPMEEVEETPSITFNVQGAFPSLNDDNVSFKLSTSPEPEKKKEKKKVKPASLNNVVTGTISDPVFQKDEMLTTDKPYETKYSETTAMLKGAIVQLDGLLVETLGDANEVRKSKTLKRKWDILPLMNNNAGNIISNKISAIREINNTISKCNDLELKRMKDMNLAAAANENSDKKIMDMYNAFVSMPTGDAVMPNNLQNVAQSLSMGNVVTGTIIGDDEAAYQNYVANLNPAQRLSMYESNPDIKQVVVYNQQTGARYFEVMDMGTGQVVPGVDKHDSMFLEGTTLDLENKIARNIDLGETYPIVIVGEPVMNMY